MDKTKLIITFSPILISIISLLVLNTNILKISIRKKIALTDIIRRLMIISMACIAYYYENYHSLLMLFSFEAFIGYLNEKLWNDRYERLENFYDRLINIIINKGE